MSLINYFIYLHVVAMESIISFFYPWKSVSLVILKKNECFSYVQTNAVLSFKCFIEKLTLMRLAFSKVPSFAWNQIVFVRYLRMHPCSHLSSRGLFSKITEPDLNIKRVERVLESYANPRLRLGFV